MRSKIMIRLLFVLAGVTLLAVSPVGAAGKSGAAEGGVPVEKRTPLAPGTVITTQNWQQYKDYMPLWMQVLFAGHYQFKLAPNQQIVVGPTIPKRLPRAYLANTEKYSGQVRLRELADGGTTIDNYVAGLPFPNPTEPHIADKLIWNLWYRYLPQVEVGYPGAHLLLIDRFHHVFRESVIFDYMRLNHVSEPDQPIYNKDAPNLDITLYTEITEPEQSKYTVALVLYFLDPAKPQEQWSFVPSLRRPLRLSASARCSPAVGTDLDVEDQKSGFNMQIPDTIGKLIARKPILTMDDVQPPYPQVINFFDSKIAHQWGFDSGVPWPPPPAKWQLRDTWVVEARRVPSKLTGYCYGNRRMYVDALDYRLEGEELYDMGGKLWKLEWANARQHDNGYGDFFDTGSGNYNINAIDVQNSHMTVTEIFSGNLDNGQAPAGFHNVKRYASPTGLLEIMQ